MNTTIPDLWPPDFGTTLQPAPAAILRQQGYLLGQKTRNFVIGEVESHGKPSDGFTHELVLSVPLINYRQPILKVKHGIKGYPAELIARYIAEPSRTEPAKTAGTADEFLAILRSILNRDELLELVRSLLDQCQDINE